MEVVRGIVGNVADSTLAAARDAHAERGTLERVVLDDDARRRSRVRVTTDAGRELGVVLGEETPRPGDVLLETDGAMVVVAFASVPAVVVDLSPVDPAALVRFGHDVGNRHRSLTVRDGRVYVALERGAGAEAGDDLCAADPRLAAVLPDGVDAAVERVDPTLFDDAGRGHYHSRGGAHSHTHDHSRGADERHSHDHDHSHD